MKGGSVLLLALLLPTIASAASAPRRAGAGVCDPGTRSLRKMARLPKTGDGPVARPSTRAQAGLSDTIARLHRGSRTSFDDDDEAIQNDAPAAWLDVDECPLPALEPIGALVRAGISHPKTQAFSPRSPRGPPLAD